MNNIINKFLLVGDYFMPEMVYKFFDKKSKGSGVTALTNKSVSQNQQLAEELHKPIIKKF